MKTGWQKAGTIYPQKMYTTGACAGRFESLVRVLPYCDEVALFDNENGFVEVAEYTNGN